MGGGHVRNILQIIGQVLGRYIRAQLILGLIVGTLNLIGLLIFQVPLAPVLALFNGFTEMVPMIGPWIGGITSVIITLALAPEKAIYAGIVALVVQLLENNLLVPRIQGGSLHIHPAVALVLLTVGTYVAGFWGLVLSVPLAATVVQVYRYLNTVEKQKQLSPSKVD